jgi:hypothetical protein
MKEVSKVTLSTDKVVLLRELKISHLEKAEKVAGSMTGLGFIKALIQQLVVVVDDVQLKPIELESIDDLFSVAEFMQLAQVVGNFVGTTESVPTVEMAFGAQ